MNIKEMLNLKPDVMLKDKYNIGFICTAKEAQIILIKEQVINGYPDQWAERFEVIEE